MTRRDGHVPIVFPAHIFSALHKPDIRKFRRALQTLRDIADVEDISADGIKHRRGDI
jgi:hypothetical protein